MNVYRIFATGDSSFCIDKFSVDTDKFDVLFLEISQTNLMNCRGQHT